MEFRQATVEDIPKIVDLLKLSLGEEDLPLSGKIWNYKHLENPFGKSIVFIAVDNELIVGVRAFMQWRWQLGKKEFTALRSVDAATHPSYQRQGIFKKLTLQALDHAKKLNHDFVFNTPNDKSLPGNLKLGWKIVDRVEAGFKPSFSSLWVFNKNAIYEVVIGSEDGLEDLCKKWNAQVEKEDKIFVPKDREYLKWRYEENPIQPYEVVANKSFYIAAYIKKRKGLKELRVSECLISENQGNSKLASSVVKNMALKFGAQVITFSSHLRNPLGWKVKGKFGPVLVLKGINLCKAEQEKIRLLENWNYSLGDLELF